MFDRMLKRDDHDELLTGSGYGGRSRRCDRHPQACHTDRG